MIRCYTGTPGSGKSLHSIKLICNWLRDGKNVISNFPLKIDDVKHCRGHYYYMSNEKMTVPVLMQFSKTIHEYLGEGQTLIVVDEASIKFNSRTFMDSDRLDFLSFFAQHRHYGFEIVLITQQLNQIDKQIRELIEIEVVHRKLNNYWLYSWLPFSLFIAIEKNLVIKDKNDDMYFLYSKYYGSLYDTFYEFNAKLDVTPTDDIQAIIEASELIPDSFYTEIDDSQEDAPSIGPCGDLSPGPDGAASSDDDVLFTVEDMVDFDLFDEFFG